MKLGIVMTLAIILLMSTMFVGVLASQVSDKTELTQTTETVDLANARFGDASINNTYYFHLTHGCPKATSDWRSSVIGECALAGVTVKNSTGDVIAVTTDYVIDTDATACTGDDAGDIHFENTDKVNTTDSNTTTVTYSYCGTDYLSGWSNSTLSMLPGIFVLMILCSCFVVVKVFEGKDN